MTLQYSQIVASRSMIYCRWDRPFKKVFFLLSSVLGCTSMWYQRPASSSHHNRKKFDTETLATEDRLAWGHSTGHSQPMDELSRRFRIAQRDQDTQASHWWRIYGMTTPCRRFRKGIRCVHLHPNFQRFTCRLSQAAVCEIKSCTNKAANSYQTRTLHRRFAGRTLSDSQGVFETRPPMLVLAEKRNCSCMACQGT